MILSFLICLCGFYSMGQLWHLSWGANSFQLVVTPVAREAKLKMDELHLLKVSPITLERKDKSFTKEILK